MNLLVYLAFIYMLPYFFSLCQCHTTNTNSKETRRKDILVYRARLCGLLLLLTVVDTTFVN